MSLSWPRLLASAFVLLLSVLAVLALGCHSDSRQYHLARASFEREIAPLDYALLSPTVLSKEGNAATWLRLGSSSLQPSEAERELLRRLNRPRNEWSTADIEELQRIRLSKSQALASLYRAIGLEESSYGVDYERPLLSVALGEQDEMQPLHPPWLEELQAHFLLAALARDHHARDQHNEAWQAMQAVASLATALAGEPNLVAQLLSIRIDRTYLELVHDLVLRSDAPEAVIVLALAHLDPAPREAGFHKTLAMETLRGLAVLPGGPDAVAPNNLAERVAFWLEQHTRREATALLDLYQELARAARLPAGEVTDSLLQHQARTQTSGTIAAILYPNLLDWLYKRKEWLASAQLGRLALRLQLHNARTGRYPSDLHLDPEAGAPDAYVASDVQIEKAPAGSITLSLPEAEAYWQEKYAAQAAQRAAPRFRWILP